MRKKNRKNKSGRSTALVNIEKLVVINTGNITKEDITEIIKKITTKKADAVTDTGASITHQKELQSP